MHIFKYLKLQYFPVAILIHDCCVTGKQRTESLSLQLTVSMSKYQEYLKMKYNSLPLLSPEELLECSSSEYVSLLLKRFNEQT